MLKNIKLKFFVHYFFVSGKFLSCGTFELDLYSIHQKALRNISGQKRKGKIEIPTCTLCVEKRVIATIYYIKKTFFIYLPSKYK